MSKHVDKYCLDVTLKTTEFCQFFKGHDRYTYQDVILKVFKLELLKNNEFIHKKVLNESNIADKLDDPHMVKPLSCLQTKHNMYLVYEYFSECNLKNYIQRKTKLDPLEAVVKLRKLLEILIYLKSRRVIHRNLKSSVFLVRNNEVFLSNYLNAIQFSDTDGENTDVWNNNLSYTAPENYFTHIFTFKSDVFSVGVIFYEMLTGKQLMSAEEIAACNGKVPEFDFSGVAKTQNWPPELFEFMRKILALNPEKRFSAEDALQFIDKHFSRLIKSEGSAGGASANGSGVIKVGNDLLQISDEGLIAENYDVLMQKVKFLNRFGDMVEEGYGMSELAHLILFVVMKVISQTLGNFLEALRPDSGKLPKLQSRVGTVGREIARVQEIVEALEQEVYQQIEVMQKSLKKEPDVTASNEISLEVDSPSPLKYWPKIKAEVIVPFMESAKRDWEDTTMAKQCEDFIRFYEYGMMNVS
jgi:serine/threonine protein kinase